MLLFNYFYYNSKKNFFSRNIHSNVSVFYFIFMQNKKCIYLVNLNLSMVVWKRSTYLNIKRHKSFSAIMSEALQNYHANKDISKGTKKKRIWETNDSVEVIKKPNIEGFERVKRRKFALLLGYSGANYYGMQRNPGMKTIEEELFVAMLSNKIITEEIFKQAQLIKFQRAARTDKGVSAARQCCSLKLPEETSINVLNDTLPDDIRIFSLKRVTKGFNSKDHCDARTYTYTLPTISFVNSNYVNIDSFKVSSEIVRNFNDILSMFTGTKNFHNFTSRKNFEDPSSKRYIMTFKCDEPFITPRGCEFATIKIRGQSFMLHQIRKMIGLALAVLRGNTDRGTIVRAFTEERLDIPMAPGLGLVLDQVHYDKYNRRYGDDGIHQPLSWESEEPLIQEFINKNIMSSIFEKEFKENVMSLWLETLPLHSFSVRENDQVQQEHSHIE